MTRPASRCKWFMEFIDTIFPEDSGAQKSEAVRDEPSKN